MSHTISFTSDKSSVSTARYLLEKLSLVLSILWNIRLGLYFVIFNTICSVKKKQFMFTFFLLLYETIPIYKHIYIKGVTVHKHDGFDIIVQIMIMYIYILSWFELKKQYKFW